jgi:hypothetical protein
MHAALYIPVHGGARGWRFNGVREIRFHSHTMLRERGHNSLKGVSFEC